MGSQQQIGNWAFLFQLERLEAWSLMQKTRGAWVKNRTRIMYCHPEETVASVGNFSIPAWKWYAGLVIEYYGPATFTHLCFKFTPQYSHTNSHTLWFGLEE